MFRKHNILFLPYLISFSAASEEFDFSASRATSTFRRAWRTLYLSNLAPISRYFSMSFISTPFES